MFKRVNHLVRHYARARGTDKLEFPIQGGVCSYLRRDKLGLGEATRSVGQNDS